MVLFYLILYIYVYIIVDREKVIIENVVIIKNIVGMNFRICYYKKKIDRYCKFCRNEDMFF